MPDLSEFVGFVASKSGINKPQLVEQDILIHRLLKSLNSSPYFALNYLFKGGSCLVKCYFGYYRFSVDLDFTWKKQAHFNVGKKERQKRLKTEIRSFGQILEDAAGQLGLDFTNDATDKHYIEFGGSKRMVTFKLWKGKTLVKVQVNFVEELLFPGKKVEVRTLLDNSKLSKEEHAYFSEFIDHYSPFFIEAYDEREILCEKVRAILTRKAPKLRDFYDLFILNEHGFKTEMYTEKIVKKTHAALVYRKYRDNLEANKKAMEIDQKVFESPYERSLFIENPPNTFDKFINELFPQLRELTGKSIMP